MFSRLTQGLNFFSSANQSIKGVAIGIAIDIAIDTAKFIQKSLQQNVSEDDNKNWTKAAFLKIWRPTLRSNLTSGGEKLNGSGQAKKLRGWTFITFWVELKIQKLPFTEQILTA